MGNTETRTKRRIKKGVKKAIYNTALIFNLLGFVYVGFFKDCHILGVIFALNSLYFSLRVENLEN